MKALFTAVILSCFITSTAFPTSKHEEKIQHLEDESWLADLTGLPSRETIEKLSLHVDEMMQHDKNKTCTAINSRLRKMIFLHFMIYQHMANQRGVYLNEKNVRHWAHVFGMLLKESSGDTTNLTSMTGRSYSTYEAKSDLNRWREIAKLSKDGKIPLNYQTNFGLTQLSVDRLFVALQLARKPAYLKGRENSELNTAVAVRRLIWFYQDFAQGRLTQTHDRIHHDEQGNPEYSTRFAFGVSMALLLCGTHYMFYEGYHKKAGGVAELTHAMASIAYCKLGNAEEGYGVHEINEKCFAEWVTLCPTLNFDIAMVTPLQYFATRNEPPVCEETFNALLNKKTLHDVAPPKKTKHGSEKKNRDKTLRSKVKQLFDSASTLFKSFFIQERF